MQEGKDGGVEEVEIEGSPKGRRKQFLAQKGKLFGVFTRGGGEGVGIEAIDEVIEDREGVGDGELIGRDGGFEGLSVEVFEHGDAGAGNLQEGDGTDSEIGITGVEKFCFFKIDGDLRAGDEVIAGSVAGDPVVVDAKGVGVAKIGGDGKRGEMAGWTEVEAGSGGELEGERVFVDGAGRSIHGRKLGEGVDHGWARMSTDGGKEGKRRGNLNIQCPIFNIQCSRRRETHRTSCETSFGGIGFATLVSLCERF